MESLPYDIIPKTDLAGRHPFLQNAVNGLKLGIDSLASKMKALLIDSAYAKLRQVLDITALFQF